MLGHFHFQFNSFCRLLHRSGPRTSAFSRWHCRRVQFERLVHRKSGHRGLYFNQDFRRWKTYILCLKNSYIELQFNRILHILCPRKTGWYLCVYIGLFPSEEIKLLLILCGCQLICHQRMSIVISQLVNFNYYSIYWGHRGSLFFLEMQLALQETQILHKLLRAIPFKRVQRGVTGNENI